MGDFYQTRLVATFHRLGQPNLRKLESELAGFAQHRPIAPVLPSLYSELEGPALPRIIEELIAFSACMFRRHDNRNVQTIHEYLCESPLPMRASAHF